MKFFMVQNGSLIEKKKQELKASKQRAETSKAALSGAKFGVIINVLAWGTALAATAAYKTIKG